MSFLKEFKTFAMRGNVVDMAVGIIIGGAFGRDRLFSGKRYHYAPDRTADRRSKV